MKVLVTGANGYLGQGIVKKLLEQGCEVIATDFSCSFVDGRAKSIECSLFEVEEPFQFFGEPQIVLHLAWRDGFIHNSKAHLEDISKHVNFIENMCANGIDRVAVMGSMHEVGFYEGCINENTPCNPMSMYGIAKNALRSAVDTITKQYNIKYQWLRGYYIVGNTSFGNSIFSKICAAEQKGQQEFPFTMGQNQYDFLNYDEFCHQVAKCICQEEITGIINICSGKPEKLADRVERFIAENGFKIKLKYGVYPDRPYDSKGVWGDNSLIQKILER